MVLQTQEKNPIQNTMKDGKLVGIITNRDLKFETDFTKKISESMTSENLITAPEGITLDEAKIIQFWME